YTLSILIAVYIAYMISLERLLVVLENSTIKLAQFLPSADVLHLFGTDPFPLYEEGRISTYIALFCSSGIQASVGNYMLIYGYFYPILICVCFML
ncbi:hypothetical protein L9F63_005450, partial [Diploptera punctata]